jgi:hypothetical protein
MAAFPHVSMGRPFQEKYADVKWEVDQTKFDAWKDGMTGYPIVDAVGHLTFLVSHNLTQTLYHALAGNASAEDTWYVITVIYQ